MLLGHRFLVSNVNCFAEEMQINILIVNKKGEIYPEFLDYHSVQSTSNHRVQRGRSARQSNQLSPSAGWLRRGSFTAAAQPNSQEDGRHHQGFCQVPGPCLGKLRSLHTSLCTEEIQCCTQKLKKEALRPGLFKVTASVARQTLDNRSLRSTSTYTLVVLFVWPQKLKSSRELVSHLRIHFHAQLMPMIPSASVWYFQNQYCELRAF
jgi:hypothetical protein